MDADWSVELGHDDPVLEFPWESPDGSQRYVDLSRDIEAVEQIPEAMQYPKLYDFLRTLNRRFSPWLTVKCDVWLDHKMEEAERIQDASMKMCSYIDLIRREDSERFSLEEHERWVKGAAGRAARMGTDDIACEFVVRRCWYHVDSPFDAELAPGFYITLYVFGYGNSEIEASARWGGGLTSNADILTSLPG